MFTSTSAPSRASFSPVLSSPAADLAMRGGVAVAASLFVALCAHIAIPVPFSPVPFTLQPFAVILVGLLLGPGLGAAAMIAYLCEGAAGLPVFTPQGLGGIAQLLGPTGGFLFAYPAAAAVAGWLFRMLPSRSRFVAGVCAGTAAIALIFACGATWFGMETHLPAAAVMAGAVLPFLPSDLVKVCAAAGIATALQNRSRKA